MIARGKPTIKKEKKVPINFQNTVANCNEDATELIIICSRSKDRSIIFVNGVQPPGAERLSPPPSLPLSQGIEERCRRKAERERDTC